MAYESDDPGSHRFKELHDPRGAVTKLYENSAVAGRHLQGRPQPRRYRNKLQSNRTVMSILHFCFICLLSATCVVGQATVASSSAASAVPSSSTGSATRTISATTLPTTLSLPPLNYSNPAIQIDIPARPSLYITLNICSLGSNTSVIPAALVSTSDTPSFGLGRSTGDASSGGIASPNRMSRKGDLWQLSWTRGFANWTRTDADGDTTLSILVALGVGKDGTVELDKIPEDLGNVIVQVSMSTLGPLQYLSRSSLFLGDTTQNTALLLSPLLLSSPQPQPTYPNYTLPRSQLVLSEYPGSAASANLTTLSSGLRLVVVLTTTSPTNDGLDNSHCAALNANISTGYIADPSKMLIDSTTQWMSIDGDEGFRTMWVLGDLVAQTNYTAWLVDDQGGMSSPIWFSTKEGKASFPCQLVLPNPLCPGMAYAAPLEPNSSTTELPGSTTVFPLPLTTLPDPITTLISKSLDAFSTSLLSSACGRDLFSHVSSCFDCYSAYRDWICRIAVPQCASTVLSDSLVPPQTIARTFDSPRVADITPPFGYSELLPCLSTCNNVDRKCPAFMAFRCPRRRVNADQSYAFLGMETDGADGAENTGPPALDRWGNRWCNG